MIDDKASWRSHDLGPARTLELSQGRLRVHVTGEGPPIVFVHGALVNANLWRKVVPRLDGFKRVTLDMPLGSHLEPMPGADFDPPALAALIADAIEALGLEDVTLVGNDTGGALSQLVATQRPERIGRLVLTSCDAFENFPPKLFRIVLAPARFPGVIPVAFAGFRLPLLRRLPIAFGWLTKRPIDREAEDSYVLPALASKAVRKDLRRLLAGIAPAHTLGAAEGLMHFPKPALIAWSSEDRLFPPAHGERLAKLIPDARLAWIEDAYTFSPEDQPGKLAERVSSFARERGVAARV
ncbi:MAG TPA: alpha/beta hydrolase [Thermoleophilaceae bacterium]|nr:alpha/beta hydrolase [Thermoleophilaceae bacterium]